jgi:O-antigen/teichoic acid export membrane protein
MDISDRFKKYFFNTSWLLFERIARTVIQIIVGVIVTRYQGPERFGLLSYATSYIGIFAAVTSLGMDSIVVQMLVQSSEKRNNILSTSLILRLLSGGVALVMIVVSLILTHENLESSVLILVISVSLVIQAFNVFDFHFQSIVASKYFVYASIFQNIISSVLRIVGVLIHAPVVYFAWLVVADAFLLALGLSYYYWERKRGLFQWVFDYP